MQRRERHGEHHRSDGTRRRCDEKCAHIASQPRQLRARRQQTRAQRTVQRTGHAKQPRHRRKRELQADASGGEGIRCKQDRQRRQQRCRRVILSPEQRRKQHQRRHKRRAQHRRTSARHDRKHDHQRQTDDSGRAPVSGKETQKAQQKRQMQPRDRDRVHDAGRAQRDVEVLRIERGLIAEHERLRKRQHVRRERRLVRSP